MLRQVRSPLPTPPVIFDVIVVLAFAWGGWKVWRMGSNYRPIAILLWLVACGGLYSLASVLIV